MQVAKYEQFLNTKDHCRRNTLDNNANLTGYFTRTANKKCVIYCTTSY